MNISEKIFYSHLENELKHYQKKYSELLEIERNTTNKQKYKQTSIKRKSLNNVIKELEELINICQFVFDLY